MRNFEFLQKWPKFLEFWAKMDHFCKNKFQSAVFKWKSSNFVNFDIWSETMDSQVFLDVKMLAFWVKFINLNLEMFFWILGNMTNIFWILRQNRPIFTKHFPKNPALEIGFYPLYDRVFFSFFTKRGNPRFKPGKKKTVDYGLCFR